MGKGWKIIADIRPTDGHPNSLPHTEYFVVSISDRDAAVEALKIFRGYLRSDLTVVGEAAPDYLEKYNVKEGEIFSVAVFG